MPTRTRGPVEQVQVVGLIRDLVGEVRALRADVAAQLQALTADVAALHQAVRHRDDPDRSGTRKRPRDIAPDSTDDSH